MIAVDANLLVYAHREDSPWYENASRKIGELAESRAAWAIPWPRIDEFLAIVTHPQIYTPPIPLTAAIDRVEAWLESPSPARLAESEGQLRVVLTQGHINGPLVYDARVATICLLHGVEELWTVDRDFGRFPALTVRNPLVG